MPISTMVEIHMSLRGQPGTNDIIVERHIKFGAFCKQALQVRLEVPAKLGEWV